MTMRLASKAREKAELPAGYQFGDARHHGRIAIRFVKQWDITADVQPWSAPHLNAAERLARNRRVDGEPRT